VHTKKHKKPLNRGNTVPEVGLELHSLPRKHRAPPETGGIRASLAEVRPGPKPEVWTMYTPPDSRGYDKLTPVVVQAICEPAGLRSAD
jgi:hypothetical protein